MISGGSGLLCSLFHVSTGRTYISNRGSAGVTRLAGSSGLIKAVRPADPKGQPVAGVVDLNGWTSVTTVTPETVGQNIAVYTSLETKRTKGGRVSPAQ